MRTQREEEAPMAKAEGHGRAGQNTKRNAGKTVTGKVGGEHSERRGGSKSVVVKNQNGVIIANAGSKYVGERVAKRRNKAKAPAPAQSIHHQDILTEQFERVRQIVDESMVEPAVVSLLLNDFVSFLVERAPRRSTMSEDERAWLIESGAMTADEIDEAEKEIAGGALSRMELRSSITPIATALGTKEVADRLKIDETRVRHRLAKDGLYSIKVDGRHRFPEWQFTEDASTLLPGLKQVIQALPGDLDPASVEGLMTSEQDNLLLRGKPVTPREWLQAGGSVDDVIDVIEGIAQ